MWACLLKCYDIFILNFWRGSLLSHLPNFRCPANNLICINSHQFPPIYPLNPYNYPIYSAFPTTRTIYRPPLFTNHKLLQQTAILDFKKFLEIKIYSRTINSCIEIITKFHKNCIQNICVKLIIKRLYLLKKLCTIYRYLKSFGINSISRKQRIYINLQLSIKKRPSYR